MNQTGSTKDKSRIFACCVVHFGRIQDSRVRTEKFSNEFVTTHLYALIEALNITSELTMMINEGKVDLDLLLQFDKYIRPKSLTEETYNVRRSNGIGYQKQRVLLVRYCNPQKQNFSKRLVETEIKVWLIFESIVIHLINLIISISFQMKIYFKHS